VEPNDDAVRAEFRYVLDRTGLSQRQLSLAMGRDASYVSAFLDEKRHPRAVPTPGDLWRLAEKTGIPLVDLLERFWGIPPEMLAEELGRLSIRFTEDSRLAQLTDQELDEVLDFAGYLVEKRGPRG
jgi:transcriptional regulator with XRE-family HTH domain